MFGRNVASARPAVSRLLLLLSAACNAGSVPAPVASASPFAQAQGSSASESPAATASDAGDATDAGDAM